MRATTLKSLARNRSSAAQEPTIRQAWSAAGLGAGAGAVAEYLLDPVAGRTRRALIRDKATHAVHRMNTAVDVISRDLSNRSRGLVAESRRLSTSGGVDDSVLHERVRATLGRYLSHPSSVDVQVQDGAVTVSGDVLRGEEKRAGKAVAKTRGVRQVETQWQAHPPGTNRPDLQGTTRTRRPIPQLLQENWAPAARALAGTGAALLWVAAGRPARPVAWPLRAFAAVVAARAATNLPIKRLIGLRAGRRAVNVQEGISIAAPPQRVWELVSDYANFPRFLTNVREVRRSEDGRTSHWQITGAAGISIRFDAEETHRTEGHEIAWHTTPGEIIAHSGVIRIDPDDGDRSRVLVRLTYNPVAGAAGHAVATLLGADPQHKLQADLLRLQSFIETGKTPADAAQKQ